MGMPLKVLIIEDCEDYALLLERALIQGGFVPDSRRVESTDEFETALIENCWDLILADYVVPGFGAIEALKILKSKCFDIPFIVVSGKMEEETAVQVMRAGAHDFITKSNMARLIPAITRELGEAQVRFWHKSAEQARIKGEERYRLLTESITDVFFAVDKNLRCTFWNRAAENLTNISIKSALSRHIGELFPDAAVKNIEMSLKSAAASGTPLSFAFHMEIGNVSRFIEMNIYPTESGLSVLAKDITERKKAEELQRTRDEMEKQLAQAQELRLLGQLTSGVAHEVRNPLNAISVVMEALFQEIGDNEEYLQYKEHIFAHVERLKRLMQDLLELGKPIEHSKIIDIHLKDLVKESVDLWKSSGPHENLRVIIDVNTPEDLLIKGDPHKLQQVLMNLLENASQHSPAESEIKILVDKNECACRIRFIDQGSGIKTEHIKLLFEPFFTTRRKGTGLGLAIVRHIIDMHGGSISIYNNNPSPGCTVDIGLPLFDCGLSEKDATCYLLHDQWTPS